MENNYFENTDWLNSRLGRITASEVHKIFVSGKKKGELFGQGAMTYIRTKAAEILTQEVKEEIDFKQAAWGKDHELEAWQRFEKETGFTGEYYGASNPKFFEVGDWLGYSPDWVNDIIVTDFKCPYNSSEHLKNMMLKTADDIKKERWEYYCQLQFSMHHGGKQGSYFVSYDPRYVYEWMQIKIISVLPDAEWLEEYKMREDAAIKELKAMVKQFTSQIVASYDSEVNATIIQ